MEHDIESLHYSTEVVRLSHELVLHGDFELKLELLYFFLEEKKKKTLWQWQIMKIGLR